MSLNGDAQGMLRLSVRLNDTRYPGQGAAGAGTRSRHPGRCRQTDGSSRGTVCEALSSTTLTGLDHQHGSRACSSGTGLLCSSGPSSSVVPLPRSLRPGTSRWRENGSHLQAAIISVRLLAGATAGGAAPARFVPRLTSPCGRMALRRSTTADRRMHVASEQRHVSKA